MDKREILQRLFYVDKLYDEKKFSGKNSKEVKEIISSIKIEVMNMDLKDVKERVGNNLFLLRLEGEYCKLIEIDLEKLCICDIHQLQFRNKHTLALRGELFKNIIADLNVETAKKVNSIKKIAETLLEEIPSIVRKYGERFEVLMGNHRIMSLIQDGERTCNVLCICEEHEAENFPNLVFER